MEQQRKEEKPSLAAASGDLYFHECCEAWSQYPLCLHTMYAQPESFEWDEEYAQLLDYLNGESVVSILVMCISFP